MADLDDAGVAERLAAGDLEALAEIYARYGDLAFSVALSVVGDAARAEDVVQESFLKLWRNAGRFDPERGSVRAWLTTIARRQALETHRGRAGHERRELDLDEAAALAGARDPWGEVSVSLARTAVREALASLPPEQRRVIELAYFGGLTCREIAEVTHVPLGTVKGRMRLGMEKLHACLDGRRFELDA
jgi:RNA polymerase sigma-70 factor (ECF subfamily)